MNNSSFSSLAAVDLSLDRTFGRWQVHGADEAGRSSVLIEARARRLALRNVTVHLKTPVQRLEGRDGRVVVWTGGEQRPAAAVVVSADPYSNTPGAV